MGSYHRIKVLENFEVSERFLPTLNATSWPGWLHDFAPSPSLEIVVLCQPVNYDFLQSWQDTRWSYFQNQRFTYCFNVPKKSNHLHLHDVRKIYLIDSRKSVMMRMSNLPFASCVASASICFPEIQVTWAFWGHFWTTEKCSKKFFTLALTVRNTQTQWDKGLYTIWSRFYWKTTFISNIVTLVGNRQGPHLTWKKSLPVASGLGNQTGRQKPEADHRQRQTAHYLRTSERPQSVRENLHLAPHCSAFTLARSPA